MKIINFNQIIDDWRGFTHLCNRLIKAGDQKASVYLKDGKDYGVDARSGDKKTNYQFKYHQKFSSVLSDLKDQALKVKDYRSKGGIGQQLWEDVDSYHVMTSADLLPQWEETLVPLYTELGIKLTIEAGEDLRLRIERFPELYQWFWEGKARFFYQLDEQIDYFKDSLGDVGRSTFALEYVGRTDELTKFDRFLRTTEPALQVVGPAGSGKSRFLIEAGSLAESAGWNVLFADSDQSLSDGIFGRVTKVENTILFLDEPRDPDRLRDLIVQIQRDQSLKKHWRVVVGLRTHIDGVTKTLDKILPGKKEVIELDPINKTNFLPFIESLLRTNGLDSNLAKPIEKMSGGIPVWAVLACEAILKGMAPTKVTREEIISFKLEQICDEVFDALSKLNSSKASIQDLVRRLATFEPINSEDSDELNLISDKLQDINESQAKQIVQFLVEKQFCQKRGRLVRIQPEIVRDYIVAAWLVPNGAPSGVHKGLITDTPKHIDRLINAIGRTEYIYGGTVDLLGQTCSELKEELKTLSNSKRYSVLKGTDPLSIWRPIDFADFCRVCLNHPQPNEIVTLTFFDEEVEKNYSHEDLVKQMAWPLFHSAMYSQTETDLRHVLDTLKLVHRQENKLDLVNDGKRVRDVAPRFVKWGTRGTPVVQELCLSYCIEQINQLPLSEENGTEENHADLIYFRFFLAELVKTEFRHEEWNDFALSFSQWDMPPTGKPFEIRTLAKDFVFEFMQTAKWKPARLTGWALIDEVIRSENQFVRTSKGKDPTAWRSQVKRSFELLPDLLANETDPEVLNLCRRAWNWTIKFSTDKELKDLAKQAEAVVAGKESLTYVNLLNKGDKALGPSDEAVDEIVKILTDNIRNNKIDELIKAISQIQAYQGDQYLLGVISHIIFSIAVELPNSAPTMATSLQANLDEKHQSYVGATLRGLRVAKNLTREQSNKLFNQTWSELAKNATNLQSLVNVVSGIYPSPFHPKVNNKFDKYDFEFLQSFILEAIKTDVSFIPYFCHLSALALDYDLPKGLKLAKDLILKATPSDAFKAFLSFIRGIHHVRLFEEDLINVDTFENVLNLLITIPDIGRFDSDADWELKELSKKIGGVSLPWLVKFFEARTQHFQTLDEDVLKEQKYQITSSSFKIWKLVRVDELLDNSKEVSESTKQLLSQILCWTERRDMLGYLTPNIVKSLDPHGRIAPDLIKEKIKTCDIGNDAKNLLRWVRFVGFYFHNEAIWTSLALAVMNKIKDFDRDSQRSLYHYMTDTKPQVYSSSPGEIPPALIAKRDFYKERLSNLKSEHAALKDFYEWCIQVSEADIAFEQQQEDERWFE